MLSYKPEDRHLAASLHHDLLILPLTRYSKKTQVLLLNHHYYLLFSEKIVSSQLSYKRSTQV